MANHIATHCPRNHATPTPAHRTARGHCRACRREDEARSREAGRLFRTLENMTPRELADRLTALGA